MSPLIWRRLLVRTNSTLADFHYALQIAFDWTDAHLHRFHIHGHDYGISRRGGLSFSSDAHHVRLSDFHFHINERFLYEYNLTDRWEHEVRIERHMTEAFRTSYPVCVGGRRAGPEENCGGLWAYMAQVDHHRIVPPWEDLAVIKEAVCRLADAHPDEPIRQAIGDLDELQEAVDRVNRYTQFQPERIDRRAINRRLQHYAQGDARWQWE